MNNKIILFLIILILAGVLTYLTIFNCTEEPLAFEVNSFEDCVSAGYPVLESYPRQCKTPEGKMFSEDIGNELEKLDLIKIENPRPNQTVSSPLLIKGEARGNWYFEASFPVKLYDDKGFLLAQSPARALDDWMTEDFVNFSLSLPFSVPGTQKGILILEKDNPSGLVEQADQLVVPVYFNEMLEANEELMTVEIFLSDSNFVGEPYFDCSRTVTVDREVLKTEGVGRAALKALLRGATEEEIDQGWVSSVNPGVRIQSLKIENGVAKVDFDEQLGYQVGGSCRVAAIRAQITDTLLQFPTVDSVVISIDGRTEDILQP